MAADFAAGCVGGCAGVLVGHPFDTVKVHLQTQDASKPRYSGAMHCFRTILARDSMRGLYRGVTSPMGGIAFVNAIVFGVHGNVQRRLDDPTAVSSHAIAGAAAGFAQSFLCGPMELTKTRLQLQTGAGQFRGPLHLMRHILKTEGARGLFRGTAVTAVRDCPAFASYFFTYEMLMRTSIREGETTIQASTARTLFAGGMAGVVSWALTFPIDVVKSRLQADGMSGSPRYSGAMDCLRKSYAAEGHVFLFRGLTSTLVRAFPTNAATFVVVDWCFRLQSYLQNHIPSLHTDPTASVSPMNANNTPSLIPTTYSQVTENSRSLTGSLLVWCEKLVPSITQESNCGKCPPHSYKGLAAGFAVFHEAVCDGDLGELADMATKACMKCTELRIAREVDVRLAVMAS